MISQAGIEFDASFRKVCQANHWRRTSQRRTVFACLWGNREHPRVDAVWKGARQQLPEISLDSVYRILDEFAAAGIIRRLDIGKFIHYDPDVSPHSHHVCLGCGRIQDFRWPLPEGLADACREMGRVSEIDLRAGGLCRACAAGTAAEV